jgi:hypothetical protein
MATERISADIVCGIERTTMSDQMEEETGESGCSDLPVVVSGDERYHASLALSMRVPIGRVSFIVESSRWCMFQCSIRGGLTPTGSVMAMLSLSTDLQYDPGSNAMGPGQFLFVVVATP